MLGEKKKERTEAREGGREAKGMEGWEKEKDYIT